MSSKNHSHKQSEEVRIRYLSARVDVRSSKLLVGLWLGGLKIMKEIGNLRDSVLAADD